MKIRKLSGRPPVVKDDASKIIPGLLKQDPQAFGCLKGDRAVGLRTFPIVIGIIPTALVILSSPLLILFITLFSYESLGMNLLGTIGIIGVCCMTFVLLLNVSRRLEKSFWIKGIRPKIRFLHVLLQCSLVAFL